MSNLKAVLVIDDTEINLELLNDFLQFKGFLVICAKSYDEVLLKIRSLEDTKIGAILLDVEFGDISGYTVLKNIHQQLQYTIDVPCIAISARSAAEEEDNSLNNGCNFYLEKPVDLNKLENILNALMKHEKE